MCPCAGGCIFLVFQVRRNTAGRVRRCGELTQKRGNGVSIFFAYAFIGASIAYFADRRGIDWYAACVAMWPFIILMLLFMWVRRHWF